MSHSSTRGSRSPSRSPSRSRSTSPRRNYQSDEDMGGNVSDQDDGEGFYAGDDEDFVEEENTTTITTDQRRQLAAELGDDLVFDLGDYTGQDDEQEPEEKEPEEKPKETPKKKKRKKELKIETDTGDRDDPQDAESEQIANAIALSLLDQQEFDEVVSNFPPAQQTPLDRTARNSYRAWLANKPLNPGARTSAILKVAMEAEHPTDPELWAMIGEKLQIYPATWAEILGRSSLQHLGNFSNTTAITVEQFCEKNKLDIAEYHAAMNSKGYTVFGTGTEDDREIAGSDHNAKIIELTRSLLGKRLDAMKKVRDSKTSGVVHEGSSRQRSLDRLAWVMNELKTTRECVAVAKLASDELRLFANVPDNQMMSHFIQLMRTAIGDVANTEAEIKAMFDILSSNKPRGKAEWSQTQLRQMERRLRKTLVFLNTLNTECTNLRVIAHTKQYTGPPNKDDRKVHAETQGAAVIVKRRMNLRSKTASAPKREEKQPRPQQSEFPEVKQAAQTADQLMGQAEYNELDNQLEQTEIAIGISKLCCFYCWLMLGAMAQSEGIAIKISGTHFNTYKWPVPDDLTSEKILTAFLGLNRDNLNTQEQMLANALKTPKGRAAVIQAIKNYEMDGGDTITEYPSSEDESDIDYRYTVKPSEEEVEKRKRRRSVKPETGTKKLRQGLTAKDSMPVVTQTVTNRDDELVLKFPRQLVQDTIAAMQPPPTTPVRRVNAIKIVPPLNTDGTRRPTTTLNFATPVVLPSRPASEGPVPLTPPSSPTRRQRDPASTVTVVEEKKDVDMTGDTQDQ